MKRLFAVCLLAVVVDALALGQPAAVPARWIGTWVLSLPESKVDKILGPGLPLGGLTLTGQTLKIESAAGHMKVTSDTDLAEIPRPAHEEFGLNLNHGEGIFPGLSFKRIDDSTFDVILSINNQQLGNDVGENHFVFSADGKTLTETKVQTKREFVPEGTDQTKAKVIATATMVLVFHK